MLSKCMAVAIVYDVTHRRLQWSKETGCDDAEEVVEIIAVQFDTRASSNSESHSSIAEAILFHVIFRQFFLYPHLPTINLCEFLFSKFIFLKYFAIDCQIAEAPFASKLCSCVPGGGKLWKLNLACHLVPPVSCLADSSSQRFRRYTFFFSGKVGPSPNDRTLPRRPRSSHSPLREPQIQWSQDLMCPWLRFRW